MNAIPLVFNAPKANINVNSVSPINGNSIRTNNKLINATQGMNIGGAAGMLGGGGFSNEAQLRQEVNTSIVALKREAFSLENLIAQAAQTLQDINKRLSELEGKQGDYVKKADATVESVGGSGKYISAISETDGKINATATDLATSVASGNSNPVTSGAVYDKIKYQYANFLVTSGNSETAVSVETTQPIDNFNYLIFIIRWGVSPYLYDTRILPMGVFAVVNRQIMVQNVDGVRARFQYVDNRHIKCWLQNASNSPYPYYEVLGIL